jgi:hypothetical protein
MWSENSSRKNEAKDRAIGQLFYIFILAVNYKKYNIASHKITERKSPPKASL